MLKYTTIHVNYFKIYLCNRNQNKRGRYSLLSYSFKPIQFIIIIYTKYDT